MISKRLCWIYVDLGKEHKSSAEMDKQKTFKLPDENFITVGAKRFRCQRSPRHFLKQHERDVYIRKELYADVVLSRGTTMFREVVVRITNELKSLAPFTTKIKVVLRFCVDRRIFLVFSIWKNLIPEDAELTTKLVDVQKRFLIYWMHPKY